MAVLGGQRGEVDAVDEDAPRGGEVGCEKAADIGEQRRLAGAGRTHDRQRLAGRDAARRVASSGTLAERDRDGVEQSARSLLHSSVQLHGAAVAE